MKYTITILLLVSLVACQSKGRKAVTTTLPNLVLQWETDTLMTTCECVLYDKDNKQIYVANINQNPWELDTNGFISIIDLKGNIIEHKWVKEDLSGPKGMGMYNGKLYVNDINRVVEIDIPTQSIQASYYLSGKPALNDISISKKGRIFTSDSNESGIYELTNGHLEKLGNTADGRLNGLYADGEKLYFTLSQLKQFGYFDLNTRSSHILSEPIGWGDGIVKLNNGDFITTGWEGEIYYINSTDWQATQLLDTREEGINAADLDYIPELDIILVPTFFNNTVRAYKLVWE